MAQCNITYNGTIISTADEETPVSIMYNGTEICTIDAGSQRTLNCNGLYMNSNVVIGSKTLNCNKKIMSSNVIAEIPMEMPVKGQIITMDLGNANSETNNRYRVLKVNGNIAECLALYDCGYTKQDSSSRSVFIYKTDGTYISIKKYQGSTLDTLLNTTFYNSLSTSAKNAIVSSTIYQDAFYIPDTDGTKGSPYYTNKYIQYSRAMTIKLSKYPSDGVLIGQRYVYSPSIQDIIDYLDVPPNDTTGDYLHYNNIMTMFFDGDSSSGLATKYLWFRSSNASNNSLAGCLYGPLGKIESYSYSSAYMCRAVPVFKIDLTKIEWM